ncbi:DUF1045 domain-containing protein [Algirhabdus cladophorae]|uniref:DUF1045 domain-containing protein n=1 Tax=Algirhabdus cladophorae TaxID=3377108 RepID=UPI003B848D0E
MDFERYAVYYTPAPDHPITHFAAAWLGWDVHQGRSQPHPDIADLPQTVDQITQTPRKYGFHGTLKAPFYLAKGKTLTQLQNAVDQFASSHTAFEMGHLRLGTLGHFVALVLAAPNPHFTGFAAACVQDLDGFRAPMTQFDLNRRRAAGLTPQQDAYLTQWGYPYILECFKFHLTLTGSLPPDHVKAVAAALETPMTPLLAQPFWMRHLTLCGQSRDGRFHVIERFPLAPATD